MATKFTKLFFYKGLGQRSVMRIMYRTGGLLREVKVAGLDLARLVGSMIIGYAGQGAVQYAPLSPTNHMANWAHQHHHQQHHHHNKHHHHQHHRQLHHHHHQHHCHQYYRHQTVKKGVKKSWVILSITFFNNEK